MHPPRPIEDFVDILRALVDDGVSFAVIGGLQDVLSLAQREGATIVSRPQPRGVAVAFIDWHGRELNALTGSNGLLLRRRNPPCACSSP